MARLGEKGPPPRREVVAVTGRCFPGSMSPAQRNPGSTEGRESFLRAISAMQYGLFTHTQAIDAGFSASAISRTRSARASGSGCFRASIASPGCRPRVDRQCSRRACGPARCGGVTPDRRRAVEDRRCRDVPYPRHAAEIAAKAGSRDVDVHRDGGWRCRSHQHRQTPITTPARDPHRTARARLDERARRSRGRALPATTTCRTERFLGGHRTSAAQKGRCGIPRVRSALVTRRGEAALESRLEVKVRRLLFRSGLPRPVRQHRVVLDGNPYRIDFAWPDRLVAVEAEGRAADGGRRRVYTLALAA